MGAKYFKRKYEKKLLRRAFGVKENHDFLLAYLKEEWEAIESDVERDRTRRKLYDVTRQAGATLGFTLLGMAALCGVVFVSAVAPNVFSAFGRLGKHRRYFGKHGFTDQIRSLRTRGYIETKKDDEGGVEIRLTELGEQHVIKRALGELQIKPQDLWDGVWRMVLFDIPERNKWARTGMRDALKRMGFYQLQKSVFVFPYPCTEEVDFLRRLYDIGSSVRFLETTALDTDRDAKEFFRLS